jgi:type IV pilus assembly PilX-like protein
MKTSSRPSLRRRERGFALVLAMLLLLVMTIMGLAVMFNASVEQALAGTSTKISKVFYAADSGVEYAGSMLSSTVSYSGGALPIGVSSHYPSISTPDIQVTVSQPVLVSYAIRPGDEFESRGSGYGSVQIVEAVYALTSFASSTAIQANKSIDAEVGVYPKQLSTPQ